jgi:hypothetical protein
MSQRIDKSSTVFKSVENAAADRCVDFFRRPDGSYGFKEFRRDVEDRGAWTPIAYDSDAVYATEPSALAAAREEVSWLAEHAARSTGTRRAPRQA